MGSVQAFSSKKPKEKLPPMDRTSDKEIEEGIKELNKSKNKKALTDFSASLEKVAKFSTDYSNNMELLRNMRTTLVDCMRICEGAYRAKPTQGNSYALTTMVNQIQKITDRLEEAIDYTEVASQVATDVVTPFIEKLVLELGSIIAQKLDSVPKSDRKITKRVIDSIYKEFGAKIETKMVDLQKSVETKIIDAVK